jgi:hypothetical protein
MRLPVGHYAVAVLVVANVMVGLNCEPLFYGTDRISPQHIWPRQSRTAEPPPFPVYPRGTIEARLK